MLPSPLARLTLAGRTLLSKLDRKPIPVKRKVQLNTRSRIKLKARRPSPSAANPLRILANSLTSTLSKVAKRPNQENYNSIVKNFIPLGARLIVPQYPLNSRGYQLADLDGDTHKELIAAYRIDNETRTIILRKQNDAWTKAAEISDPEHDTINYRSTADITGEGKKHLIMGMTLNGKYPTLYGYSLDNNSINRLFARSYEKLDLLKPANDKNSSSKAQLAVWNKKDTDGYNIEILQWNGKQLEPLKNTATYYYRNVVPYYVQKVKASPYSPSNWYNLADALARAGLYRDALTAVEAGMRQDNKSEFKEKFSALKNEIASK